MSEAPQKSAESLGLKLFLFNEILRNEAGILLNLIGRNDSNPLIIQALHKDLAQAAGGLRIKQRTTRLFSLNEIDLTPSEDRPTEQQAQVIALFERVKKAIALRELEMIDDAGTNTSIDEGTWTTDNFLENINCIGNVRQITRCVMSGLPIYSFDPSNSISSCTGETYNGTHTNIGAVRDDMLPTYRLKLIGALRYLPSNSKGTKGVNGVIRKGIGAPYKKRRSVISSNPVINEEPWRDF